MIKFEALMRAIHKSVRDAAKTVEGESLDFIDRFFKKEKNPEALTNSNENEHILSPITCTMEFPSRSADGVDIIKAEVPLLTLCPISIPRITEVKFITELEITTGDEDSLMVAFPGPKKHGFFSKDDDRDTTNAKIEITLTGSEPPEGLKKLIEGYERALRAQIPG